MASHAITIAKASFAAACLRPDVTQLTREDIARFHTLFEAALAKCSPSNVQTCKIWLIDNIVPSSQRTAALGRFLVSCTRDAATEEASTSKATRSSLTKRKGLHILYLLNDTLHHAKYHTPQLQTEEHLEDSLQPHLSSLVELTRSQLGQRNSRRLDDLLQLWDEEQFFSKQALDQMRKDDTDNGIGANVAAPGVPSFAKETPYIMPSTHGDPATPYYDLPVANLMPHIVPNKAIPMRPDQIRALQLSAGPADETLIGAVRDFLKDVERMENPHQSLEDEGIIPDMDELGQLSYGNEVDEQVYDTYYGWSKEFCEKMKKRGQDDPDNIQRGRPRLGSSRSISRSRSRSLSMSRSPPKKRRYGQSRSRSPITRQKYHSHSRSRSRNGQFSTAQHIQQPVLSHNPSSVMPGLGGPQMLPSQVPLNPSGYPIPPRPPNYHGPWPPPPPPLPMNFTSMSFAPALTNPDGSSYLRNMTRPPSDYYGNKP